MKTERQTIVILHGWGLSGKTFSPLASQLSHLGLRVFTPDMPGFGEEPMPKRPWGIAEYALFLDTYLKQHDIHDPVLIGHSFGGRVALKYQLLYPRKTRAVILTGTPGFTPVARSRIAFFTTLAKLGKVVVSLIPIAEFQMSLRRWYYYVVGARDFYRARGVMRDIFKLVVQEELVTSMRGVACPCLLIWGEFDMIVPVSIAYRMKEVIKHAQLHIIPGADHGLPYKQPAVFANSVSRFLTSL